MYKVNIPVIATKEIEIIEKSRAEAIKKAFYLIESSVVDIRWKAVKNVCDAIEVLNMMPGRLFINEEDIENNEKRYIISIPCTGYVSANIYADNEKEAINLAIKSLNNKEEEIANIKAHDKIIHDNNHVLLKAEAFKIDLCD